MRTLDLLMAMCLPVAPEVMDNDVVDVDVVVDDDATVGGDDSGVGVASSSSLGSSWLSSSS